MFRTTTLEDTVNLSTATPREIDERNAELDQRRHKANVAVNQQIDCARDHLGARKRGGRWDMGAQEAEAAIRLRVAGGYQKQPWDCGDPHTIVSRLDDALAQRKAAIAEVNALDAEFRRRGGWTRFFVVEGGHIHNSRWCAGGTIQPTTLVGWLPEFSGMDEDAVLAKLSSFAETLCTHCFPNTPVQEKAPKTSHCPGSGKPPKPGTVEPRWRWAKCTGCDTVQTLTSRRVVRAHKPKKADSGEAR